MSTLVAAAAVREVSLDGAMCTVVGEFADKPRRFARLVLTVSCSSCPESDLAHLVTLAERGCLVLSTLRQGLELSVSADVSADV
jgi:hypothetical protein